MRGWDSRYDLMAGAASCALSSQCGTKTDIGNSKPRRTKTKSHQKYCAAAIPPILLIRQGGGWVLPLPRLPRLALLKQSIMVARHAMLPWYSAMVTERGNQKVFYDMVFTRWSQRPMNLMKASVTRVV